MPWTEGAGTANTDLSRLVAASADLCRKPWCHAVIHQGPVPADNQLDSCLRIETRSPLGERLPQEDLELELYPSGEELHLTLCWSLQEERPMLWYGGHPVWMDGRSGLRCERPQDGAPLEALARRLRALLADLL